MNWNRFEIASVGNSSIDLVSLSIRSNKMIVIEMNEKKKKGKNWEWIFNIYLRRGIMNCFKWISSRYRVPPWISFMPIDSSVLLYRGEEDCASARFIPRGRRSQELASFIKYLLNHRKDISPTWRPWIDLLSSPHLSKAVDLPSLRISVKLRTLPWIFHLPRILSSISPRKINLFV